MKRRWQRFWLDHRVAASYMRTDKSSGGLFWGAIWHFPTLVEDEDEGSRWWLVSLVLGHGPGKLYIAGSKRIVPFSPERMFE